MAYLLWELCAAKARRRLLSGYCALTLLVALPLYPLLIGEGLKIPHMNELLLRYFKAVEGDEAPPAAGAGSTGNGRAVEQ